MFSCVDSQFGVEIASIRISNGSPLVYYDHYTKLHIGASVETVSTTPPYCVQLSHYGVGKS